MLKPRMMEKDESLPNVNDGIMSGVKKDWDGPAGGSGGAAVRNAIGVSVRRGVVV